MPLQDGPRSVHIDQPQHAADVRHTARNTKQLVEIKGSLDTMPARVAAECAKSCGRGSLTLPNGAKLNMDSRDLLRLIAILAIAYLIAAHHGWLPWGETDPAEVAQHGPQVTEQP